MDKDKKLSAARKKLQEYKMNRGIPPGTGTTFNAVNESTASTFSSSSTPPDRSSPPANYQSYQNGNELTALPSSNVSPVPPPLENIPVFLDNQSRMLQNQNNVAEVETDSNQTNNMTDNLNFNNASVNVISTSPNNPFNDSVVSSLQDMEAPPNQIQPSIFTPSAPPMVQDNGQNYGHSSHHNSPFTDAGQDFPVNFFQPVPAAQEYQPVSFNQPPPQQEFFYGQPQAPLFYNVSGSTIKPLQPYQMEGVSNSPFGLETGGEPNISELGATTDQENNHESSQSSSVEPIMDISKNPVEHNERNSFDFGVNQQLEIDSKVPDVEQHELTQTIPYLLEEQSAREFPVLRTPTPIQRTLSVSSQDEKDRLEIQAFQRMKSVQEALELQLEELRRDNERLLQRQSELVSQIEDNEKNVQELRRERDRSKEDAKKLVQPLHVKINNLIEENQRILKNSNDVGMELRAKLHEKSKLHEEMEQAFIVVSTSKMDIAAELDQEREKRKELETVVSTKDKEIAELRSANSNLEEQLKAELQKAAVIHQLEDQRRHYMVQTETLQGELARANSKVRQLQPTSDVVEEVEQLSNGHHHDHSHGPVDQCPGGHDHSHGPGDHDHSHGPGDHDHSHGPGDHDHSHGPGGHDHSHGPGGHDHSHEHHIHHDHETHEHHTHDHDHDHEHNLECSIPRLPTDEFSELKKRLHHLEWENSTFRADVDKLAVEARDKKQIEEKFNSLKDECDKLRNECNRLELLVLQLEGENDTIGDYISLYQSQRLAQNEIAKEKDVQMEKLAQEREMLLNKMQELTHLLKELKGPQADNLIDQLAQPAHQHQCSHSTKENPQNAEIEGKIRNLLTEISSSTLIENFHPCAVCSGRLMNV